MGSVRFVWFDSKLECWCSKPQFGWRWMKWWRPITHRRAPLWQQHKFQVRVRCLYQWQVRKTPAEMNRDTHTHTQSMLNHVPSVMMYVLIFGVLCWLPVWCLSFTVISPSPHQFSELSQETHLLCSVEVTTNSFWISLNWAWCDWYSEFVFSHQKSN